MVLESCILRSHAGCANADGHAKICGVYTDRIGKEFPVVPMRRFVGDGLPCRNVILNADILHLYDKKDETAKTGADVIEIITE